MDTDFRYTVMWQDGEVEVLSLEEVQDIATEEWTEEAWLPLAIRKLQQARCPGDRSPPTAARASAPTAGRHGAAAGCRGQPAGARPAARLGAAPRCIVAGGGATGLPCTGWDGRKAALPAPPLRSALMLRCRAFLPQPPLTTQPTHTHTHPARQLPPRAALSAGQLGWRVGAAHWRQRRAVPEASAAGGRQSGEGRRRAGQQEGQEGRRRGGALLRAQGAAKAEGRRRKEGGGAGPAPGRLAGV